jgi:hypothetical protein
MPACCAMSRRRSRIKLALAFVFVAVIVALLWRPFQRALAVAALQGTLEGPGSTRFLSDLPQDDSWGRAVNWASLQILKLEGGTPGFGGSLRGERFRAFWSGPVTTIEIRDAGGLKSDLGAALARFPHLRMLLVRESLGSMTESDWKLLCTRLRTLPRLRHVYLHGDQLTDDALAPLEGHPHLGSVILCGRLGEKCGSTLAKLPSLTSLDIFEPDLLDGLQETDWSQLCGGLQAMPGLLKLGLCGPHLTDEALAGLAGQPGLQELRIGGQVTLRSAETFSSMPQLRRLEILHALDPALETVDLSPVEREAFVRALPNVTVKLPPPQFGDPFAP